MNRTNRIRIFYGITMICACLCLFLGYRLADELQKADESKEQIAASTEEKNKQAEDAAEAGKMEIPYEYVIVAEEGYLVVYRKDLENVYMYTGIRFDELSEELKSEIEKGKMFSDLEVLYEFLENYSS